MPQVPQARFARQHAQAVLRIHGQAFEVVELFAGDGRLGRSCRMGMKSTAMLEIKYGEKTKKTSQHRQNSFDLLTPAGLAFLGQELAWRESF